MISGPVSNTAKSLDKSLSFIACADENHTHKFEENIKKNINTLTVRKITPENTCMFEEKLYQQYFYIYRIQEELITLLTRFCTHKYTLIANIK